MRLTLSIKANAMLLILWMMMLHSAFPHTHHKHEKHSHKEGSEHHPHQHDGHDSEAVEKNSFFDIFFQSHTHTNHSSQSISIQQEKSDLVKNDQRNLVEVAVFSSEENTISLSISTEKRISRGDPSLDPLFFTCKTLRGPPAIG